MVNQTINSDVSTLFERFWEARGADCISIIRAMSKKDVWQLDLELKSAIDSVCIAIERGGLDARLDALSQQDYIEMMSWLSSEKSLVLLSEFEKEREGLTVELLQISNMKLGSAFKVFVERINTFSRAKLLAEIFDSNRIQRVEKAARGALRQC
jgi:hypothetical protein